MFEREIQFIYDFNQNKIKKLGAFITFGQLQHCDLHPAILKYISGEIDFLIYEDRQKLLKDSLFDYSGETITNYFSLISEEIKKTKRFSINYIEKLILHASSFTVNYISRPKWSLLKFIFDEEKSKSALEVKQIFNYFYFYPTLKKIITSYLDKKKINTISFDEFKALLEKIEKIELETNHVKVINEALDTMAEFFNVGISKRKHIPIKAVQYFMAEKNLDPYLEMLKDKTENPEITRFDLNDYKNWFNNVIYIPQEEIEEAAAQDSFEYQHESAEEETDVQHVDTFGGDYDIEKSASVQEYAEPASEESETGNDQDDQQRIMQESFAEYSEAEPDEEVENLDDEEPLAELSNENEPHPGQLKIDDKIVDIEEDLRAESGTVDDIYELAKEEKENEEIKGEISSAEIEASVPIEAELEDEEDEGFDTLFDSPDTSVSMEEENMVAVNKDESPETLEIESSESEEYETSFSDDEIVEEEEASVEEETIIDLENKKTTYDDEELFTTDHEYSKRDSAEDEASEEEEEPELFNMETLSRNEEDMSEKLESSGQSFDEPDEDEKPETGVSPQIDVVELLENKKMNKIIDLVFDYDMEEFASAIEKIADAVNEQDALRIVDDICTTAQVNPTSKEAKLFKSIISEYYNKS
ncbi:MAG: hypothetical protein JW995_09995 [Melioribacteraceae bacterium]|nr:hypothetical protein [Melioribacteraceae bacterium]